jgi:superfamily I DNA and/or RNA helicase
LGQFDLDNQSSLVERFRDYDKQLIQKTRDRLRQRLLNDPSRLELPSSDIGILRRESNKKRNFLSVRLLFSKIYHLILKLKPCVMMSPLTVSTYLANVPIKFDLVIFDEASQIRPHDAVTVIYRGKQIVAAGDQHQLPPTNFFNKMNEEADYDEEEETENISDMESILDVLVTKLN